MNLISVIRNKRLAPRIAQRAEAYQSIKGEIETEAKTIQLDLFNKEWLRIQNNVPYFSKLVQEKTLPEQFSSWDEFLKSMPVTSRKQVRENLKEMTSVERRPEFMRITGGSTAEPIQLPSWKSENIYTSYDMWLARSWYGITPASRLFLLWGHSHLLGSGLGGRINAYKRKLYDHLLGYYRFSAYNLDDDVMRKAGEELLRYRPNYIIGYSVALDRLARVNYGQKNKLRQIGVNAIIGAAEAFPAPDTVDVLQDLFGCPIGMEYGSVETGLIGHTIPEGGYQVFWRTYFVEAERKRDASKGYTVRVTSLFPRCFPLVRYEIGDEIIPHGHRPPHLWGLTRFDAVLGRCNDYVELGDGSLIHSEAFTHAVRWCPDITGYQVIQVNSDICLQYTSARDLSSETISSILEKLRLIHPQLGTLPIKRVERLEQTVAGKTKMVVKRQ